MPSELMWDSSTRTSPVSGDQVTIESRIRFNRQICLGQLQAEEWIIRTDYMPCGTSEDYITRAYAKTYFGKLVTQLCPTLFEHHTKDEASYAHREMSDKLIEHAKQAVQDHF